MTTNVRALVATVAAGVVGVLIVVLCSVFSW